MIGTKESANGAAVIDREPIAVVRTVSDTSRQDYLTKHPTGVRAWTTGKFTLSASLGTTVNNTRIRAKRWVLMVGQDASLSAAGEIVVKLLDNGNPTGFELLLFAPATPVTGAVGVLKLDVDLGEGYVSGEGSTLSVLADKTLASGSFDSFIVGNEEQAN